MKTDPKTKKEWQEAVDAANFWLTFDSARQYGLLAGGPTINVERCEELLKRGKAMGYVPAPVEKLLGK